MGKKKRRRLNSKFKYGKNLLVFLSMILLAVFVVALAPSNPTTITPADDARVFNKINLTCSGSSHAGGSLINYTFFKTKETWNESGLKLINPGDAWAVGDSYTNPHTLIVSGGGDNAYVHFNTSFTEDLWIIAMSIRPRNNLLNFTIFVDDVYWNPTGDVIFNYNDNLDGGDASYYKTNFTLDVSDYNDGNLHNVTFWGVSGAGGNGPEWRFWWNETNTTKYGNEAYAEVLQNTSTTYYQWDYPYGLLWSCQAHDKDMNESSASTNRSLVKLSIAGCSGDQTELNLTFYNESNLQNIGGQINSLSIDFNSDDTEDYIFTNSTNTESNTTAFCITPNGFSVGQSGTITYDSTSFVARTVVFSDSLEGGVQVNKSLYLLPLADGQYVTFQVVDVGGSPINGVTVTATKVIGGNSVVVGSGTTDSAGGITFWLDPLSAHTISATKSGVGSLSTSITPSQTSYTLTLGSQQINSTSYSWGMSYNIQPTNIMLNNDTLYNFTFNVSSIYWNLTSYGFGLYNSTGLIDSVQNNTPASGGVVNIEFNTTGQENLNMWYWWNIGGNITNSSKSWNVQYTETGNLSISNFFTDFVNYAEVGFNAGFGTFCRILLCIVILFLAVAGLTWGFGLYSPTGIMGVIAFVVFALEATNLMPPLYKKYVLTVFTAFILIGFIIQEQSR